MAARRESGSLGRAWRAVLSPGVALMNRLRYGPKFVLIGVLFLIPLFAVATLQFRGATEQIVFNSKESDGVAYITGLRKLLHAVEQHRILSGAGLTGRRGFEERLVQARTEADRLTNEIDALRAQGRIDESNNLVGAQNAAVDNANALAARYNALVDQYNAKVGEINVVSQGLEDLYKEVTPIAPTA